MQEIKKSRIVLASVLKPVDDTRMFEKFAQSLASRHEVHVLGYPTTHAPSPHAGIVLHPSRPFARLSLARALAPWRIFRTVMALKPALLIVNTHELLWPALAVKWLTRCALIYDVRENYYRNILHTQTFPPGVRHLLAVGVRLKEKLTAPFIDYFLLAEKSYLTEMRFLPNRTAIVENKLRRTQLPSARVAAPNGAIHLLFSGTLAASTGVFVAVDLACALHAQDAHIHLTIIGYCARQPELEKLQALIQDKPFITLTGGNSLVPHPAILNAIAQAHFGIVAYPPNPATKGSIPTKLYEYLGYSLPILLTNHPQWQALCQPYHAALSFDAQHIDAAGLIQAMKTTAFYTAQPQDIYWENEEARLENVVNSLI